MIDVYRGYGSVIRAAEVAPKCLLRSLVVEKKEDNLKVALVWAKHGKKRRKVGDVKGV